MAGWFGFRRFEEWRSSSEVGRGDSVTGRLVFPFVVVAFEDSSSSSSSDPSSSSSEEDLISTTWAAPLTSLVPPSTCARLPAVTLRCRSTSCARDGLPSPSSPSHHFFSSSSPSTCGGGVGDCGRGGVGDRSEGRSFGLPPLPLQTVLKDLDQLGPILLHQPSPPPYRRRFLTRLGIRSEPDLVTGWTPPRFGTGSFESVCDEPWDRVRG